VLGDQGDGARPGRQGVEGLRQRHPDIMRIGYPGRPVQRVASNSATSWAISGLSSKPASCTASERGGTVSLTTEVTLLVPTPGGCNLAGVTYLIYWC
jgi:hypothetical protein